MSFIYINGIFYEDGEAKISVRDRSFRFGDGLFETIGFSNNQLYRWDLHKKRLEGGLVALKIDFNTERLESDILKTIERNKLTKGSARITITRGEGSRGYLPTYQKPCNVVIEAMENPKMDREYANLCISSYKKIPKICLPVNYKISQGLNSTLAKIEAREKGFFEALQLNIKDEVAEGASSNIFWAKGGKLYTPSLACDILNGITRQVIIEKSPYKIIEGKYKLNALKGADEIFICNSLIGILFVNEIDGLWKNQRGYNISADIKNIIKHV